MRFNTWWAIHLGFICTYYGRTAPSFDALNAKNRVLVEYLLLTNPAIKAIYHKIAEQMCKRRYVKGDWLITPDATHFCFNLRIFECRKYVECLMYALSVLEIRILCAFCVYRAQRSVYGWIKKIQHFSSKSLYIIVVILLLFHSFLSKGWKSNFCRISSENFFKINLRNEKNQGHYILIGLRRTDEVI